MGGLRELQLHHLFIIHIKTEAVLGVVSVGGKGGGWDDPSVSTAEALAAVSTWVLALFPALVMVVEPGTTVGCLGQAQGRGRAQSKAQSGEQLWFSSIQETRRLELQPRGGHVERRMVLAVVKKERLECLGGATARGHGRQRKQGPKCKRRAGEGTWSEVNALPALHIEAVLMRKPNSTRLQPLDAAPWMVPASQPASCSATTAFLRVEAEIILLL